mmetsp:Transcript_19521/g.60308  ORF Transcript_19521/g.60308 Transcript_19521/m.60308 type:complete len:232 (+) Transcript_19521:3-698(+)
MTPMDEILHWIAAEVESQKHAVESTRCLLELGASEVSRARASDWFTPLHVACARGFVALATLLVSRGADVNAVASGDVMPLHVASEHADPDTRGALVSLLRKHGARTSWRRDEPDFAKLTLHTTKQQPQQPSSSASPPETATTTDAAPQNDETPPANNTDTDEKKRGGSKEDPATTSDSNGTSLLKETKMNRLSVVHGPAAEFSATLGGEDHKEEDIDDDEAFVFGTPLQT